MSKVNYITIKDNEEKVETKFLMGICRVFGVIKEELGSDFPVQHLAALLDIAAHPNTSIGDMGKRLGMGSSVASRAGDALSDKSWTNRPGHGLVIKTTNIRDPRSKSLNLTDEGKRVVKRISDAYFNEQDIGGSKEVTLEEVFSALMENKSIEITVKDKS